MNRAGAQLWATAFAAAQAIAGEERLRLEDELSDLKARLREQGADLKAAIDENMSLLAGIEELNANNTALAEQCASLTGQLTGLREMLTVRRKPGPKPKLKEPTGEQAAALLATAEPPAPAPELG